MFASLGGSCATSASWQELRAQSYEPDGEDLSEALLGRGTPKRMKPLFWEYGRNTTSFGFPKEAKHRSPNVAVRDGDWKLLVNADGLPRAL